MLYGPPPDPRQILLDLSFGQAPLAWMLTIGIALLVLALAWRLRALPLTVRYLLFISGLAIAMTAPLALVLEGTVYGSWPTIDKAGSYLFYGEGVHLSLFQDPLQNPALKLIGVHVGHLFLVQALDLFLTPHGAFNALSLLLPLAGWFCAWLLFVEVGAKARWALVFAMPFGMGLHVFRDLNWATIEKAAIFGLPLYLFMLLRAQRRGGLWIPLCGICFALMSWLNIYLGLLNGPLSALFLLRERDRRSLAAVLASFIAALPLVLLQGQLMEDAGAMAEPLRFLKERAALDVFSLWPPGWVRLEWWRSLDLPMLALGLWGLWRHRRERVVQHLACIINVFFVLSIGPCLFGLPDNGVVNPLFMILWQYVPGFWRVAKPEFFFEVSYLGLLGAGAVSLSSPRGVVELDASASGEALASRDWRWIALFAWAIFSWVLLVRSHPAFPGFTEPVEVGLSSAWQQQVFEGSKEAGTD